jgi:hypothetical protein
MFVRIRRRKLNGWASCGRTASASYDLVQAVRINGKPRQKFVMGLGSLKTPHDDTELFWFWHGVIYKLREIDAEQRGSIIAELMRKGVPLPSEESCEKYRYVDNRVINEIADIRGRIV